MDRTPGTDARPTFVEEVREAVTGRAALLVIGALVLQLAFITSYVGAFHAPKPKDVALGVVAPRALSGQLVERLSKLPGRALEVSAVPDRAAAVSRIRERDLEAALIVDPRSTTDTLLVAGGAGSSLAQATEAVVTRAEAAEQRSLKVTDIVPVAAGDSRGLSSFYLVVGWCVGGYLCAAILAISAGARPANARRAGFRLTALALYAAVAGLLGAVITGPGLDALPGSVLGLWGLGTLVVFAVGATTLALQGLAGIVGIGLAIAIVVVLGNPSAGGAYPYPLLPSFWRVIGPALPPGAGTWSARSIAYFQGNALTCPLLVLSAWAVAGTAVTMVCAVFRRGADGTPHGGAPYRNRP
ncbi:membrane protein [Streptomyces eurocidicus]|uniref:Membrane protein n=1 Tax=Streptomyces eurocidicus TaxID=66423 RepID=A0A2N8NMK2_STREU|nr:DUF3533 domain-containing protein [Streptomyces eurocidicus]MBB5120717.1 hypothetical protein [Streptomyces eurocidicus]MBF6050362.1 DUF3533 domain-containing protein [Streptomyces eurocidicus]PNE30000.1 membrane protein [Streptomyces eurocidicus]